MFKLYDKWFKTVNDLIKKDFETVNIRRKHTALNVASVFDIEATSFYNEDNEKRGVMYAWVFGINGKCIRGRTWEEFVEVLNQVIKRYNLSVENRLIVYVHNLSYEFQWIKKLFEWETVFSIDERKPIYAVTKGGIEFRCSYLLSGYNLATVGKKLQKYKVQKMVGDLDYDLKRHTETPLTETEWGYILNDGLVVMAFIQEEIERLGDISCLPITKTGYVRELCREECLTHSNSYKRYVQPLTLEVDEYVLARKAFMGGFTHANHNWVGETIQVGKTVKGVNVKSIGSFDITSSYPTVLVSEMFPMTKGIKAEIKSKERLMHFINNYACLMEIRFININATFDCEHYIPVSKCYDDINMCSENGRVINADCLTIALTELDFKIILKTYEFESLQVVNFYYYFKSYIPKEFVSVVLKLYNDKTILKGVEGSEQEYMQAKEMLNSMYGMCVTDICRNEIIYDGLTDEWRKEPPSLDTSIKKYNDNKQRYLSYLWGVWTTAYARTNLWKILLQCGNDYVYSDTDSLKIINYEKYLEAINDYNYDIGRKIYDCLKSNKLKPSLALPKNSKGIEKPLGVWDFEGRLNRFKTLGAKRYLYENENKELTLTISGVSKVDGVDYLFYRYKTIPKIFKAFDNELVFPPTYINDNGEEKRGSGKLVHTYIDIETNGELEDYLGNKAFYHELSSIHLEPTSYEMSLTENFLNYLLGNGGNYIL